MHRSLLSAVLSLSVLLSALATAHAASYTFTTIDAPNAIDTVATGINTRGQIVGEYVEDTPLQPTYGFLYKESMENLGIMLRQASPRLPGQGTIAGT